MRLELLEHVTNPPWKGFTPYYIYQIMVGENEVGTIVFREGNNEEHYYDGHIGYFIEIPYRGNHYAYQACKLLKDIILTLGYQRIIITCNPDNIASKKTIEKLGADYIETLPIPSHLKYLFNKGEKKKRIYQWRL